MFRSMLLSLLFYMYIIGSCQNKELPPTCDSPIYCYGDLLKMVQLSRIYKDSKTFVDMKMINSQEETLQKFEDFTNSLGDSVTEEKIKIFVEENFEQGNELDEVALADFVSEPPFVQHISNDRVKEFTKNLIAIWPSLARRVKPEVSINPQQYSIIPVPNSFIIPGGRFREYYYWDSYWIIDGLLISGMNETAQGMVDNFVSIVERFGFVPNGGRVYYLRRSQPPLLTFMARLLYQQTQNKTWLLQIVNTLAKELQYWEGQIVTVRKGWSIYKLAHYNAESAGPRPESYREDVHTAAYFPDAARRQQVYIDLKSGAESGWDFSSRWFFDKQGGNEANITFIETRRVLPVDLNAYLCGAYKQLSEFYSILNLKEQSLYWELKYLEIQDAIEAVLWNDKDEIWYDYDLTLDRHRKYFYPSALTPLWSKCFDDKEGPFLGKKVLHYLRRNDILNYLGGIPTSLLETGEQWDFPNAWPPLQEIFSQALKNSMYTPAIKEAKGLVKRWVKSNMEAYEKIGSMFEKYDAVVPAQYGGGGEYDVQSGFGWTNGVVLRFIYDHFRK